MKKFIFVFMIATIFMVLACKKEDAPVVTPSVQELSVPDCLKEPLPDLTIIFHETKETKKVSWKNGGACGTLANRPWKSYANAEYSLNDKSFFSIAFPNYYLDKYQSESSGFDKIPLRKGKYKINAHKYNSSQISCSTSGFDYWNCDLITDSYELDTTKVNTIEVLDWNEQTKEVCGVYNVNYANIGVFLFGIYDPTTAFSVKDCYFKATVK